VIGTNKLFATWKNQESLAQSLTLAGAAVEAAARTEGLFELSVCPSMTALASVARECVDKVATTAQNMGWDDPRSLTGETSATDLTDLGCRYVINGDSERRRYLAETNDMIARKLRTAFAHRLAPILCLGDSLEEHRAGRSAGAVRSQLEVLLRLYQPTDGPFLIAYEPAWAIHQRKRSGMHTAGSSRPAGLHPLRHHRRARGRPRGRHNTALRRQRDRRQHRRLPHPTRH
jgi:triosephosphate isomerase